MVECGVSYFGVRRVKHVKKDLEDLAEHGATYVIHTMSENDWCFYYKTMHQIIQETHRMGLKAWLNPWCLGYIFGADADSLFSPTHPEVCQIDQFGRTTPCACLNQPVFIDFVKKWIDVAVDLGPDMLFWDEPHFYEGGWFRVESGHQPGRWGCHCSLCKSLFQDQFGETMPHNADDERVIVFRSKTLKSFLDEILSYAKTQGAKNALCLLPDAFASDHLQGSDSIKSLPCIDNLGTDPYPFPIYDNPPTFVENWKENNLEFIKGIVDVCQKNNIDNHFWVQGFSIPAEDHGYLDQIMDMAVENGINNIAVWGFDGHRDMSTFACEESDKVWEQIGQGFKRVRGLKEDD